MIEIRSKKEIIDEKMGEKENKISDKTSRNVFRIVAKWVILGAVSAGLAVGIITDVDLISVMQFL